MSALALELDTEIKVMYVFMYVFMYVLVKKKHLHFSCSVILRISWRCIQATPLWLTSSRNSLIIFWNTSWLVMLSVFKII